MNENEKIGTYKTDEILEFMTEGEGKGFLGRSMFDAMYFKIKNLQSKIDKAIEFIEKSMNNQQPFYEYLFGDENGKVENLDKLLNILKEDK